MTVAELIERLQQFGPSLEVKAVWDTGLWDVYDVGLVEDVVVIDVDGGGQIEDQRLQVAEQKRRQLKSRRER